MGKIIIWGMRFVRVGRVSFGDCRGEHFLMFACGIILGNGRVRHEVTQLISGLAHLHCLPSEYSFLLY